MFGLVAGLLAAAVAAEPAAPTGQALFDSASAAVASDHCADALRDFAALEARGAPRSPTVAGMIALRKGRCLAATGRNEAAEAALTVGLATIGGAPAYVSDRALALLARGKIAYARLDFPAATADFAVARDLLPPADRFEPLLWLTRATLFDPGDAARGYADEALALAASEHLKADLRAHILTLHARVLLNHGDVRGGYAELRKALYEQGGLGTRVGVEDIVTRSDLAVAALLAHDDDNARKYLAYTGAGHGTPFGSAADMTPPACDGADLTPDDRAVVEFGIGDDGAVAYATPVYVSRLGPAAATMARAVAGWSWKPEALAKIAPLFRAVTRVEVRCSTASAPPPVVDILQRDLRTWLASAGAAPFDLPGGDAAALAAIRAELARRRAATPEGVDLIPVLVALGRNRVIAASEQNTAFTEARKIARSRGAPAAVQTLLAIDAAFGDGGDRVAQGRDTLRPLLGLPAVAADPRARAVVRLLLADAGFRRPPPADAGVLLRAVADDPALPASDPLRSAAQIRLASLYVQNGDLAAARTAYAASGVSAQQCALVDARPAATSLGMSSSQFPQEALRWGFEGWVRLEFDVTADGHTAANRAVIAYPPFVFGPSAVAASHNWRYEQSFRPDGVAGCNGAHQQIRFKIG